MDINLTVYCSFPCSRVRAVLSYCCSFTLKAFNQWNTGGLSLWGTYRKRNVLVIELALTAIVHQKHNHDGNLKDYNFWACYISRKNCTPLLPKPHLIHSAALSFFGVVVVVKKMRPHLQQVNLIQYLPLHVCIQSLYLQVTCVNHSWALHNLRKPISYWAVF